MNKITKEDALNIFREEFSEGVYISIFTSLEQISEYRESPNLFRHNMKILYQLDFPEEYIPLNSFKTVGDVVSWVLKEPKILVNSEFVTKEQRLNIIITGRSGAGKSSFLNYLINKDYFPTGDGSPVTSLYFEEYIYKSPETGVEFQLFDTKGLEPDTTQECKQQILDKIRQSDNSLDVFRWIHTVYYCFDASAKRIQTFEINFIKELMLEVSVVILLTKRDCVDEQNLNCLIEQIKKDIGTEVQIIPVCSVEKRTRKGVSVRSGREDVLNVSFWGLWNKMSNVLPSKLVEFMKIPYIVSAMASPDVMIGLLSNFFIFNVKNLFTDQLPEVDRSFTLEYLCNYPDWPSLKCDFNSIEVKRVEQNMSQTNRYFNKLSSLLSLMNVDDIWSTNERLHKRIFDFYKKVNKVTPRILYSNKAKEALCKLKDYDLKAKVEVLYRYQEDVVSKLKDVENCLLYEDRKKKQVIYAYYFYRDHVKSVANELNYLIQKFIDAYKVELYQYGRYCIRKDSISSANVGPVSSVEELNEKEKIYYEMLMWCLENHSITSTERQFLDYLREIVDIPMQRAGLIEDYVRMAN